ncbi:MAG: MFS transporter [Rhodobacteraceae bacterium]|nr:MFS transporter [Paracoccaceae bacterium]
MAISARQRIWGWYFFDFASQPYNTLLLTFIFAPYVKDLLADGSAAQAAWGYGIGAAGLAIALLAPFLGAVADRSGRRMPFIWLFSGMYVAGAWALWWARPDDFSLGLILLAFGIGLVGMEFATTFTNAMLPDLGPREAIGRISGTGWAFGYVGGLITLVAMLLFLAEGADGRTLLGLAPAFGLDAAAREGTRAVGPLTALWYAVFMIPFFWWVREPRRPGALPIRTALAGAWPELRATLLRLPRTPSLSAYLAASMFYRDALNGIYVFGGIYAAGVLGWSVVNVGTFGILAVIFGAVFAWLGGRADSRFGPKPVIVACVAALALITWGLTEVGRGQVFGLAVAAGSALPDVAFYALGALVGAAGGALQSASRTMMVRQANPARMTEAFGLYALTGKATSFIAPLSIGIATDLSGSQQAGILPLIVLFALGLGLMAFVRGAGERSERWLADPAA